MHPTDPFNAPHSTYSPEEQEAILTMAAKLQNDSYRNASLEELEQTAMISGIDPRFVREAANRLSNHLIGGIPPHLTRQDEILDKWQVSRAVLVILAFLPAQIALTLTLLHSYVPMRLLLPGIILSGVLGLLMPSGKRWRLPTAALSFTGAAIAYILTAFRGYGYMNVATPLAVLIVWVFIQGGGAYLSHWLKERLTYEGALSRRRM